MFPRLVASAHHVKFGRDMIRSGVERLDELMGGGIDRGTSTLLIGPPGSGKSTIALQYTQAATQRSEHAAIFRFDETRSALLTRCAGLGIALTEGTGPGQLQLRQIDPAEVSPGEFVSLVRRSVEENDAKVIVIDSLNSYLNSMPQDHFLTAQLHELLSYLSNRGVTTFMVVAQAGLVGGVMTAPVEASYLADSVVLLRYFEHQGAVKKAVSAPRSVPAVMKGPSARWFTRPASISAIRCSICAASSAASPPSLIEPAVSASRLSRQ